MNLLTYHRAKGLEWDAVFLPALEEGILPIRQAVDDDEVLAEERRLLYVGITRARRHLALSWAAERETRGRTTRRQPSRFLADLRPRPLPGEGRVTQLPDRYAADQGARRAASAAVSASGYGVADDDPLYAALREWRTGRAREDGVPAVRRVPRPDARRDRRDEAAVGRGAAPGQGYRTGQDRGLRVGGPRARQPAALSRTIDGSEHDGATRTEGSVTDHEHEHEHHHEEHQPLSYEEAIDGFRADKDEFFGPTRTARSRRANATTSPDCRITLLARHYGSRVGGSSRTPATNRPISRSRPRMASSDRLTGPACCGSRSRARRTR